jgi:hypothetical protein
VSDKTDQERALEYLKTLKTDAEIEVLDLEEEARNLGRYISEIDDEIAEIERGDDPQALADVLREMEQHK